ncbi:collagen alpha-6(VI) chain [Microcaecilia unicolor]|uniref:Collagen alpha-6(VI) chain-like n=1 Tax=Microcaecilia unicolor TaxID=1415580 RepID=A0A6P7WFJ0_9AMPH|nr:collagen alpha-6(VI) chain-like [Microcaecilia unicolor]
MKAIGILFTVLSLWIGLCPATDSTNSTNSTTQCTTKQEAILVFLQDGSGSIWPQDFNKSKAFAVNITQHFQIGRNNVQVGCVQFSDVVEVEFTPVTYDDANSITSAIMNMVQLKQGTKTGKALNATIPILQQAAASRPGVPIFLLVTTDGASQDDVREPAENLRNTTNAIVYCIGVGTEANQTELNLIAGNKSRVFTVGSFDGLKDIQNTVMKQMCSEVPVQNNSPPAVSKDSTPAVSKDSTPAVSNKGNDNCECPVCKKVPKQKTFFACYDMCGEQNKCPPDQKCCFDGQYNRCFTGKEKVCLGGEVKPANANAKASG